MGCLWELLGVWGIPLRSRYAWAHIVKHFQQWAPLLVLLQRWHGQTQVLLSRQRGT
jgi:hypothetical protein